MLGPGRDAARVLREIADILDIVPDEHTAEFRAMSTGITRHMDYTTPADTPTAPGSPIKAKKTAVPSYSMSEFEGDSESHDSESRLQQEVGVRLLRDGGLLVNLLMIPPRQMATRASDSSNKSRTGWTRHTYSRGGTFVLDILPSNRMRSTAAFSASQTPPIFCRGEACPPRPTHYSGDLLAALPSDSRTRPTPRTSPSPSSSQTYKGAASASRSWRLSGRVRTTRAPRSFRTYARQIRATVT